MKNLILLLCLFGCTGLKEPDEIIKPSPEPISEPIPTPSEPIPVPSKPLPKCEVHNEIQKLQYANRTKIGTDAAGKPIYKTERGVYDQQMPVTKSMAHESHYMVKGLDPERVSSVTQSVKAHLQRTCDFIRKDWKFKVSEDCKEIYSCGSRPSCGSVEWTPAENGGIGHGSTGGLYPSIACEAATGNMYWAKGHAPKPGTRYIVANPKNGKSFVLCMGYEAGPGSKERSGGFSTEAMHYLGIKHGAVLILGRAVDQTLPYGPIECEN